MENSCLSLFRFQRFFCILRAHQETLSKLYIKVRSKNERSTHGKPQPVRKPQLQEMGKPTKSKANNLHPLDSRISDSDLDTA